MTSESRPQTDPKQAPGASRRTTANERDYRGMFRTFLLHPRQRAVPERTLRLTATWWLGVAGFTLLLLLFATGILLKFSYQPTPEAAYGSIVRLQVDSTFGQFIRNIHHWSANLLVLAVFLHLLRVFYTGGFQGARRFNWIIGLKLLGVVILAAFTGYLLPWDQLAFWAVTICANMLEYIPLIGGGAKSLVLGGDEVGAKTLTNFYAIHTAILPLLFLLLLPFHLWRVRKARGVAVPRTEDEPVDSKWEMTPTIPNLLVRELVIGLAVVAAIMTAASFINAPLGAEANPALTPNPSKAPWYFMGFQELLLHFHPAVAFFVIPGAVTAFLVMTPYFKYSTDTTGVWFGSRAGRRLVIQAALFAVAATIVGVLTDEFAFDFQQLAPGVPAIIATGLLPFAVVIGAIALFLFLVHRRKPLGLYDVVQILFTMIVVSFIVLTLIGIYFRGESMRLVFPGMGG